MRKKLETEVGKMNKFTADVLGMQNEIKIPKMDVRGYAKYVLKNGMAEEKRDILGSLKSQLSLADGKIRHTVKFVSHKHRKAFCEDLKKIYAAPSEEAGMEGLEEVKRAWPQFALVLRSWETKWPELSTFFHYPEELRHIIYTNNAIENLNKQFRKVTKTSQVFPHDEALQKLLWLAQYDISRQWTGPGHNWGTILTQLSILFPEKITL